MTGLADVDGFYLFIQVCMWPRFPPMKIVDFLLSAPFYTCT